jgi:hypothetical protein
MQTIKLGLALLMTRWDDAVVRALGSHYPLFRVTELALRV